MKKVAICICNYNKQDMIGQCLQAVSEQVFKDFDVYVCDNHSTDDSVSAIKKFIAENPQINTKLLVTDENLGGAGGFDTALRAALDADETYEYLMCVDNDCMLDEKCIGVLAGHLDNDPESGMAAAKIYFLDNPDLIQCYGLDISYELCGTVSPYFGQIEDGSSPAVVYSDAAPACALMVRTSLVKQIGLLPEENYIYWDDTTWCYRVRQAGFKVANVGAAMALHGLGQRAEVKNTFGTYYAWRNQIRYFLKTTPDDIFSEVAIRILTDVYLEAVSDYDSGNPEKCAAVMAALDDAIHGVTGKARDGIIGPVTVSGQEVAYTTVDSLPEKYQAGAEIFVYTHYELFLHGRSLQ
jgi:GT2 family glycosyltransferase